MDMSGISAGRAVSGVDEGVITGVGADVTAPANSISSIKAHHPRCSGKSTLHVVLFTKALTSPTLVCATLPHPCLGCFTKALTRTREPTLMGKRDIGVGSG